LVNGGFHHVPKCFACGSQIIAACFRYAGFWRALDEKKRGYLCACPDHVADAEKRWRGANASPIGKPESPRPAALQSEQQGSLGL
jgi:hypothetical protein